MKNNSYRQIQTTEMYFFGIEKDIAIEQDEFNRFRYIMRDHQIEIMERGFICIHLRSLTLWS